MVIQAFWRRIDAVDRQSSRFGRRYRLCDSANMGRYRSTWIATRRRQRPHFWPNTHLLPSLLCYAPLVVPLLFQHHNKFYYSFSQHYLNTFPFTMPIPSFVPLIRLLHPRLISPPTPLPPSTTS